MPDNNKTNPFKDFSNQDGADVPNTPPQYDGNPFERHTDTPFMEEEINPTSSGNLDAHISGDSSATYNHNAEDIRSENVYNDISSHESSHASHSDTQYQNPFVDRENIEKSVEQPFENSTNTNTADVRSVGEYEFREDSFRTPEQYEQKQVDYYTRNTVSEEYQQQYTEEYVRTDDSIPQTDNVRTEQDYISNEPNFRTDSQVYSESSVSNPEDFRQNEYNENIIRGTENFDQNFDINTHNTSSTEYEQQYTENTVRNDSDVSISDNIRKQNDYNVSNSDFRSTESLEYQQQYTEEYIRTDTDIPVSENVRSSDAYDYNNESVHSSEQYEKNPFDTRSRSTDSENYDSQYTEGYIKGETDNYSDNTRSFDEIDSESLRSSEQYEKNPFDVNSRNSDSIENVQDTIRNDSDISVSNNIRDTEQYKSDIQNINTRSTESSDYQSYFDDSIRKENDIPVSEKVRSEYDYTVNQDNYRSTEQFNNDYKDSIKSEEQVNASLRSDEKLYTEGDTSVKYESQYSPDSIRKESEIPQSASVRKETEFDVSQNDIRSSETSYMAGDNSFVKPETQYSSESLRKESDISQSANVHKDIDFSVNQKDIRSAEQQYPINENTTVRPETQYSSETIRKEIDSTQTESVRRDTEFDISRDNIRPTEKPYTEESPSIKTETNFAADTIKSDTDVSQSAGIRRETDFAVSKEDIRPVEKPYAPGENASLRSDTEFTADTIKSDTDISQSAGIRREANFTVSKEDLRPVEKPYAPEENVSLRSDTEFTADTIKSDTDISQSAGIRKEADFTVSKEDLRPVEKPYAPGENASLRSDTEFTADTIKSDTDISQSAGIRREADFTVSKEDLRPVEKPYAPGENASLRSDTEFTSDSIKSDTDISQSAGVRKETDFTVSKEDIRPVEKSRIDGTDTTIRADSEYIPDGIKKESDIEQTAKTRKENDLSESSVISDKIRSGEKTPSTDVIKGDSDNLVSDGKIKSVDANQSVRGEAEYAQSLKNEGLLKTDDKKLTEVNKKPAISPDIRAKQPSKINITSMSQEAENVAKAGGIASVATAGKNKIAGDIDVAKIQTEADKIAGANVKSGDTVSIRSGGAGVNPKILKSPVSPHIKLSPEDTEIDISKTRRTEHEYTPSSFRKTNDVTDVTSRLRQTDGGEHRPVYASGKNGIIESDAITNKEHLGIKESAKLRSTEKPTIAVRKELELSPTIRRTIDEENAATSFGDGKGIEAFREGRDTPIAPKSSQYRIIRENGSIDGGNYAKHLKKDKEDIPVDRTANIRNKAEGINDRSLDKLTHKEGKLDKDIGKNSKVGKGVDLRVSDAKSRFRTGTIGDRLKVRGVRGAQIKGAKGLGAGLTDLGVSKNTNILSNGLKVLKAPLKLPVKVAKETTERLIIIIISLIVALVSVIGGDVSKEIGNLARIPAAAEFYANGQIPTGQEMSDIMDDVDSQTHYSKNYLNDGNDKVLLTQRGVDKIYKYLSDLQDLTKSSSRNIVQQGLQTNVKSATLLGAPLTSSYGGGGSSSGGTPGSGNMSGFSLNAGESYFTSLKKGQSVSDVSIFKYSDGTYCAEAVAYVALKRGWTYNAIIGLLSDIYAEGMGINGTFSYEGVQAGMLGPSRVKWDTTTDNDAWRSWLQSSEYLGPLTDATSWYSSTHYATGLGFTGETDCWDNGVKTVTAMDVFLDKADENGVYFQDLNFQIQYTLYKYETAVKDDSDWVDPTTYTGSAEEFAARCFATLEYPGYSVWYDNGQLDAHLGSVNAMAAHVNAVLDGSASIYDDVPYNLDAQILDNVSETNELEEMLLGQVSTSAFLNYLDKMPDISKESLVSEITSTLSTDATWAKALIGTTDREGYSYGDPYLSYAWACSMINRYGNMSGDSLYSSISQWPPIGYYYQTVVETGHGLGDQAGSYNQASQNTLKCVYLALHHLDSTIFSASGYPPSDAVLYYASTVFPEIQVYGSESMGASQSRHVGTGAGGAGVGGGTNYFKSHNFMDVTAPYTITWSQTAIEHKDIIIDQETVLNNGDWIYESDGCSRVYEIVQVEEEHPTTTTEHITDTYVYVDVTNGGTAAFLKHIGSGTSYYSDPLYANLPQSGSYSFRSSDGTSAGPYRTYWDLPTYNYYVQREVEVPSTETVTVDKEEDIDSQTHDGKKGWQVEAGKHYVINGTDYVCSIGDDGASNLPPVIRQVTITSDREPAQNSFTQGVTLSVDANYAKLLYKWVDSNGVEVYTEDDLYQMALAMATCVMENEYGGAEDDLGKAARTAYAEYFLGLIKTVILSSTTSWEINYRAVQRGTIFTTKTGYTDDDGSDAVLGVSPYRDVANPSRQEEMVVSYQAPDMCLGCDITVYADISPETLFSIYDSEGTSIVANYITSNTFQGWNKDNKAFCLGFLDIEDITHFFRVVFPKLDRPTFSLMGAGGIMLTGTAADILKRLNQEGYSKDAIAALLGALSYVTQSSPPNINESCETTKNGKKYIGFMQEEESKLKDYAKNFGESWPDITLRTQIEYFVSKFITSLKSNSKFKNSDDYMDAVDILVNQIYKDEKSNKSTIEDYAAIYYYMLTPNIITGNLSGFIEILNQIIAEGHPYGQGYIGSNPAIYRGAYDCGAYVSAALELSGLAPVSLENGVYIQATAYRGQLNNEGKNLLGQDILLSSDWTLHPANGFISETQLSPGDIVTNGSHVVAYIGNGKMAESIPSTGPTISYYPESNDWTAWFHYEGLTTDIQRLSVSSISYFDDDNVNKKEFGTTKSKSFPGEYMEGMAVTSDTSIKPGTMILVKSSMSGAGSAANDKYYLVVSNSTTKTDGKIYLYSKKANGSGYGSANNCEIYQVATGLSWLNYYGSQYNTFGSANLPVITSGTAGNIVQAALNTGFAGAGMCGAWVANAYANAGISIVAYNAGWYDLSDTYMLSQSMWYNYTSSNNRNDLKPGMIVACRSCAGAGYMSDGYKYGHVGICVGYDNNGQPLVRSNHTAGGDVWTLTLDEWIYSYTAVDTRWGYPPGVN